MTDSYRTLGHHLEYEPEKTRGSRHIANLFAVRDQHEIEAALASVRRRMPDANHHAFAWRLGRGPNEFRYSDDGEPSGAAGRPMLQQLDGHELTDVLAVVSRYFGGTKLGTGGLVRAYGGAVREALARAEIVDVIPQATLQIVHGYEDSGAVAAALHRFAVEPAHSEFASSVTLTVAIAQTDAERLVAAIREGTAARAEVTVTPSDRAP